jgi:hypothetical protein
MFSMVSKILGVIALSGWMGVANATLIFDFSWDSSNGKIIGEIYGLSDDGVDLNATGFVLTTVGGMQVNINVFEDDEWEVFGNSFDVLGGEIIGAYLEAETFNTVSYLIVRRSPTIIRYNEFSDGADSYVSLAGEFVKRVTVPEPSSVILMLLGLAGLSFARYRKQY